MLRRSCRFSLFCSQAIDQIGHRRFDRMESHGDKGDQHCGDGGQGEDPPGDRGPVGEVLQPAVHGEPREGRGDEQGDADEFQEFYGEQTDDGGDGSAEGLSDPDLFGALNGAVRGEAEQPETGNKDREEAEIDEYPLETVFGGIEFGEVVVVECGVGDVVVWDLDL